MLKSDPDVVVVGAGNAGLCAALAARRAGASVVLLECATRPWRGGNSKYTRNIRCVRPGNGTPGSMYSAEELAADLQSVSSAAPPNPALAKRVIGDSGTAPAWMESNGARWQEALNGTLQLDRTNQFFLGGGKALVNTYFATAERLGIEIAYEHRVQSLVTDGARCIEVHVDAPEGDRVVRPGAVVVAAGGFEANRDWLSEYWGDAANNYIVRGARSNDGTVLRSLLDGDALSCGDPKGFHAVAVDARAPAFEGGLVTRVDSVPLGIMLNREGRRFYDEGEDLWPKRYAVWGRLIAEQPGQIAYSVTDRQVVGRFMSTVFRPIQADSVSGLAAQLGLPIAAVERTVAEYNASVRLGAYDTAILDNCHTEGLTPPKSHWALPLVSPPFLAYPLRPGITFTYLGVAVDDRARVLRRTGDPFANLFAAGEIMAGNVLVRGYLAGFGMTIGTVVGRIAGEEAATHVRAH